MPLGIRVPAARGYIALGMAPTNMTCRQGAHFLSHNIRRDHPVVTVPVSQLPSTLRQLVRPPVSLFRDTFAHRTYVQIPLNTGIPRHNFRLTTPYTRFVARPTQLTTCLNLLIAIADAAGRHATLRSVPRQSPRHRPSLGSEHGGSVRIPHSSTAIMQRRTIIRPGRFITSHDLCLSRSHGRHHVLPHRTFKRALLVCGLDPPSSS